MAFAADSALAPSIVNSSVERTREYLTANEVEKLMVTARKSSRYAAYRPPCTHWMNYNTRRAPASAGG
jgi:hypothetical protein